MTTRDPNSVLDSEQAAISRFFRAYALEIEGQLIEMSSEELKDYLENDIFIRVTAAATKINEKKFVDFAARNAGNLV